MCKYVEFTGIPGSGKTTASKYMSNKKINVYYSYYGFREACLRRYFQRSLIVRSPNLIKDILFKLIKKSPINNCDYEPHFINDWEEFSEIVRDFLQLYSPNQYKEKMYLSWFNETINYYYATRKELKDYEIYINDEGFVNRSMTLFHPNSDFSQEDIKKYIRNIPLPDTLIYIKTDPEVSLNRLRKRSSGPPIEYKNLTDEKLLNILDIFCNILDIAIHEIKKRNTEVCEISNNKGLGCFESRLDEIMNNL